VAYDLWGDVSDDASDAQVLAAARAWQMSEAGTICARAALDYTLARVPNIDRSRIWTAGHSSAATTSLLVASREKRVKACVAFAPATDIPGRLAPALGDLDAAYPGFRRFIEQTSPDRNTATLTCPVFLFHAEDDGNVPVSESAGFAAKLSVTNARVRFVRVPSGGHYDSMIQEGVPLAIRWLKAL
jgi:dipeptidyl aminopeptidase/acylaminoacyl peptidase